MPLGAFFRYERAVVIAADVIDSLECVRVRK